MEATLRRRKWRAGDLGRLPELYGNGPDRVVLLLADEGTSKNGGTLTLIIEGPIAMHPEGAIYELHGLIFHLLPF